MKNELNPVLKYVRGKSFEQIRGNKFQQHGLYSPHSIGYTTLFLQERSEFVEALEKDHKVLRDLDRVVPEWIKAREKEAPPKDSEVSAYIKELCDDKPDSFLKRIEFYAKLQAEFGINVHGDDHGFILGKSRPVRDFNWFLEQASLRMPLAIPALSYQNGDIFVRRNAYVYDTAVKKDVLKDPHNYGLVLPKRLNRDGLLEGLEKRLNLKRWLMHEEGEKRREGVLRKEFDQQGNGEDYIVDELVSDYYAIKGADGADLDMMLFDALIRAEGGSVFEILTEVLQTKNPIDSMKKIIEERL